MAAEPELPVGRLEVLAPAERELLVVRRNATAVPVPAGTVVELLQAQAARTPDATAVIAGDEARSYAELHAAADRLARLLIGRGIGPERVVGLCLPRSPALVEAVLATLKAGGAFLPLDPDHPAQRLAALLADAAPACVLTVRALAATVPADAPLLVLDDPATVAALAALPAVPPGDAERRTRLHPGHPAYLIYTSGSTGKPKAVTVAHAGLPNLAISQAGKLGLAAASRVLQFAAFTFDAAVWETVVSLCAGATLIIAGADERGGDGLASVLRRHAVSHALLPPAVLPGLSPAALPRLATLVVGGEACSGELAALWSQDRRLINAYGPTEATVCATMSGPLKGTAPPPIGRPLPNYRAYVLDGGLQPCAEGVVGELYVAGVGLARATTVGRG